jgi:hypothetical protein
MSNSPVTCLLDKLDPVAVMQARNGHKHEPLYVICRSGSRGQQACEKFLAAGFTNVVNVEGGTLAWAECGLPVVRGKKAISLAAGPHRRRLPGPARRVPGCPPRLLALRFRQAGLVLPA